MPKSVTVTLGERQYTIREKHTGQNIEWRTRLRNSRVYRIVDSLEQSLGVIVNAVKKIGDKGTDWTQMIGAAHILPVVANGLLYAVDDVWDLLFAYAPEIKADEEWIKENAYDDEGVTAFIELLKLLFPIMALWAMVSGSRVQQTPTNLPVRNGASNGLSVSGPSKNRSTSLSTATSGAKGGKQRS